MKKIKGTRAKKIICFLMMTALLVTSLAGCGKKKEDAKTESKASDGKIAVMDNNGKTFVSIKDIAEKVGGKFTANGDKYTVAVNKDNIEIAKDNKDAKLNSKDITMEEAPIVKDDTLYVPLTFANDVIDAKITYDDKAKTVDVKTQVELKYSKGFSITYLKGGVKKVTDGDKKVIIQVPEGKEAPEEYKNETTVTTPLKNVLLGSTTQACDLRAIGELGSIKAVTTKEDQWQIGEVADAMKNKTVEYVGQNSAPDYEKITKLKPDFTFVYSGESGLQDMMKKLDELNLPYASCNEYVEEDPLGRMEWMKFLASFYNKEDEACKYFDETVAKLDEMKATVSKCKSKPKVAWGMVSNGKVYVVKSDSYVAKMIEMAGGDYVFKDKDLKSSVVSMEDFYATTKDADILIYSSTQQYSPTMTAVLKKAPMLEDTNPVKNKNVWCFHKDYWQSIDKTDEIITDLAAMFHPESYKDYQVKHYIKYDK